ncbi:MAG: cytochrome c [Pseudomonadota bacterium]
MRKLIIAIWAIALMTGATGAQAEECPSKKPAEAFTDDFLSNEVNIEAGKEIWLDQCTHCHGKKAYPGKAPKLKPKKYRTGFVFYRVACGFRKMPAWWDFYEELEIKQIEAFVAQGKLP